MLRTLVAISLSLATGIFAVAAAEGLTGSFVVAALAGVVAAGGVIWWLRRPSILPLDPGACSRGLKIASAVATVVALVLLARLAVFMIDPSRVGCSIVPSSEWEVRHSCLTAYYVAAQASATQPDVYDDSLYSLPGADPAGLRKPRMLGPFRIDVYEYPPQFLLLPRALALVTPDFTDFRMLWFALCGGVLLLGMVVAARLLGPAAGTRALLLAPFVWLALPTTLGTLQKGNVQVMVIAGSVLAMALFERRRWAAGGAILAFATVSKLYPGLLVVYLLVRRRWRAAAWTTAFGVAFSVLTVLVFGWATVPAFLTHLPGLMSGEAFPAFRNPAATAINLSIPGLVLKARLFGVPGMSFGAAKIVGSIYMLVALAAIVWAGLRTPREGHTPLVWLAILILATLRSPFLPQAYAVIPPMWLLTLLAARRAATAKTLSFFLLAWVGLNVYWPNDWPADPRLIAIAHTLPQALMVLMAVLALRHAQTAAPDSTAARAA